MTKPTKPMKNLVQSCTWLALILLCASPYLKAQEVFGSYGIMQTPDLQQSSFSYEIGYQQDFTRNLALSMALINEGHVSGHRRDGYAWEAWLILPTMNDHVCYAIGAGPYYYFDTQRIGSSSVDVRGTAPIFSFSATYYTDDRWFAKLILNRINPAHDIKVNTASFGIGYWLGAGRRPLDTNLGDVAGAHEVTANEVTLFAGQSVENTFFDAKTWAAGIEYRHGLLPHLDWTASYIYEGDPHVVRRNGVATQIWPVNTFQNGHLIVGMGFGVYASVDRKNIRQVGQYHTPAFSPLASPMIAYRFSENWLIRGVFNRVVSYNRPDADVFLVGLGYRWR